MDCKEIKRSVCISRVIRRYVRLQFRNGKATGLCPFHDDHHPSLVVDLQKQHYICYACGAKGDIFSFVEQIEHCSFKEALVKLLDNSMNDTNSISNKTKIINDCKLKKNDYIQSNDKSIFNIDYKQLHNENNEFIKLLIPYIHTNNELIQVYIDFGVGEAHSLLPNKCKTISKRIIFPIYNDDHYLTGFAGRLNDKYINDTICKQYAKYINSSVSDGFRKGETLYGLYRAKDAVRSTGEVYLTEGYKDTLAMHAAGFVNTVALCGTTLTDGQLFLLQKYGTDKVYLLLDGDRAGQEAAVKIADLLEGRGIEASIIALPEGDDPDSLFRRIGCKAFAGFIREASPSWEDMERRLTEKLRLLYNSDTPDERVCLDCEQLLQSVIAGLNRRYSRLPEGMEREDILYLLTHRLEQYNEISTLLNRPGALK